MKVIAGVVFCLAGLLLPCPVLRAQVAPAAVGGEHTIWIGGGYSSAHADFAGDAQVRGASGWVDLNWNSRWGLEAQANLLRWGTFYTEKESSYLGGPRITVYRRGRLRPYAALLLGIGEAHYPFDIGRGTYLAYAPAGGADYRVARRLNLRGQYAYEFWPSAPGLAGEPSHGLHPYGWTAGATYRVF